MRLQVPSGPVRDLPGSLQEEVTALSGGSQGQAGHE
jgi:hypothetical protein